jgi:hypothetical protein
MPNINKALENFESEYHKELEEILVLTSDASTGAGSLSNDFWASSKDFLAYIASSELKKGTGV